MSKTNVLTILLVFFVAIFGLFPIMLKEIIGKNQETYQIY